MKSPVLLLTSAAPAVNGAHAAGGGVGNDRVTFDTGLDSMNPCKVENVS